MKILGGYVPGVLVVEKKKAYEVNGYRYSRYGYSASISRDNYSLRS
jgi:hypothetical protein